MTSENKLSPLEKVAMTVANEYSAEQIAVIQNSVAKGTTTTELAFFLNVCKSMQLNPFNKEVWCYKDNRNNLLIFAGRDGFLSRAQKDPRFAGIRSAVVRANDHFVMNVATGEIDHQITFSKGPRGEILGAYAIAFRKDGESTIEWADWKEYNKGFSAWKTHPEEMIKKVAEAHSLKKAFGISGIQSEYEYQFHDGVAKPGKANQATKAEIIEQSEVDSLKAQLADSTVDDLAALYRLSDSLEDDELLRAMVDERINELESDGIGV